MRHRTKRITALTSGLNLPADISLSISTFAEGTYLMRLHHRQMTVQFHPYKTLRYRQSGVMALPSTCP